jgi:hypothetical protein
MAARTALTVRDALDASGADLAILGRVGSDISKYGLRFTHAGIAVRRHPAGRWIVRHLLNNCGRPTSSLYDQGLMVFYLDNPFAYDTLVLVPTRPVQEGLRHLVLGESALEMHEPAYSTLAYPFSRRYQNSNQWLLELLASSGADGEISRARAQRRLRRTGYAPSTIALSPWLKMGASLFKANVRFDDHPPAENRGSRYSVVTVRSIGNYLRGTGQLAREFVVEAPESVAAVGSASFRGGAGQRAGDQGAGHGLHFVERDQP